MIVKKYLIFALHIQKTRPFLDNQDIRLKKLPIE